MKRILLSSAILLASVTGALAGDQLNSIFQEPFVLLEVQVTPDYVKLYVVEHFATGKACFDAALHISPVSPEWHTCIGIDEPAEFGMAATVIEQMGGMAN